MQGEGILILPNKNKLEGKFDNGYLCDKKGKITHKNGTNLTGNIINGRIEGEIEI